MDTQMDAVAMCVEASDLSILGASLLSFTDDESRVVAAGGSGVQVWDIATATQTSTVIQSVELWINAIAVAPDDTLIVCSDSWVRRYDFAGQIVATLEDSNGSYLCSVSSDGSSLAVCGDGNVRIYDLGSNNLLQTISFDGATAMSLSSNGSEVAVGDYNGRVAVIDTATAAHRWYSNPPSRHRWPWTLPAILLVGWGCLAWRLSRRSKPDGDTPQTRRSNPTQRRDGRMGDLDQPPNTS